MIFSKRAWLGAGILSFLIHVATAWTVTSPVTKHHVAQARGQQISVAGALSQYMSTPQILKVEPEDVSRPEVEKITIKKIMPTKLRTEETIIEPIEQEKPKPVVHITTAVRQEIVTVKTVPVALVKINQPTKPVEQQTVSLIRAIADNYMPLKIDTLVDGIVRPIDTQRVLMTREEPVKPAALEKIAEIEAKKPTAPQKTAALAPVKAVKTKPVTPKRKIPKIKPPRVSPAKNTTKAQPVKKKIRKKRAKKKKGSNKNQRIASLAGVRGSKVQKNTAATRAGDGGRAQRVNGRAVASDYRGRVQLRLRRHQRYPRRARARIAGNSIYSLHHSSKWPGPRCEIV